MPVESRACWRIKRLSEKTVRILRTVRAKNRTHFTYGDRTHFAYTIFESSFEVTAHVRHASSRTERPTKFLSFESTGAPRLESKERAFGPSPLSWEAESGPPVT